MSRISLLLTVPILASVAHGTTILYSNLGTGTTIYNGTAGWTVGSSQQYAQGDSFTPATTSQVGEIDVALSFVGGSSNSVTLNLETNAGGTPGSVIESWTIDGLPGFGSCCTLESVIPDSSLTLDAGTIYWLVASTGDGTSVVFDRNTTGATGSHAQNLDGGGWLMYAGQPAGAFDVLGPITDAPAPEPTSLLLAGVGLVAVSATRKFRLRG